MDWASVCLEATAPIEHISEHGYGNRRSAEHSLLPGERNRHDGCRLWERLRIRTHGQLDRCVRSRKIRLRQLKLATAPRIAAHMVNMAYVRQRITLEVARSAEPQGLKRSGSVQK